MHGSCAINQEVNNISFSRKGFRLCKMYVISFCRKRFQLCKILFGSLRSPTVKYFVLYIVYADGGNIHRPDVVFSKSDVVFNKSDVAFNKSDIVFNKSDVVFIKSDVVFIKSDVVFNKSDVVFNFSVFFTPLLFLSVNISIYVPNGTSYMHTYIRTYIHRYIHACIYVTVSAKTLHVSVTYIVPCK